MYTLRRRLAVVAAFAVIPALVPVGADARSRTTVDQTIVDSDRDNRLEPGPGRLLGGLAGDARAGRHVPRGAAFRLDAV